MTLRRDDSLAAYLYSYRDKDGGRQDLLWAFRLVAGGVGCRRVLYPGSYVHITPSLVFPEVCYVDSVKGVGAALAAPALAEYVDGHKDYCGDAVIRCWEGDYRGFGGEPAGSFDLLISLNAGFISQHCGHFLKPGGFLLVNNEHYDAARAWVDSRYQLVAALEDGALNPADALSGNSTWFRTAKGEVLTLAMVESDAERPPSKARFRLAREAEAYLFRLDSGVRGDDGDGLMAGA